MKRTLSDPLLFISYRGDIGTLDAVNLFYGYGVLVSKGRRLLVRLDDLDFYHEQPISPTTVYNPFNH